MGSRSGTEEVLDFRAGSRHLIFSIQIPRLLHQRLRELPQPFTIESPAYAWLQLKGRDYGKLIPAAACVLKHPGTDLQAR